MKEIPNELATGTELIIMRMHEIHHFPYDRIAHIAETDIPTVISTINKWGDSPNKGTTMPTDTAKEHIVGLRLGRVLYGFETAEVQGVIEELHEDEALIIYPQKYTKKINLRLGTYSL